MDKKDNSLDQLIRDLDESRSLATRLSEECLKYKKIIFIFNEINVFNEFVVKKCKCDTNCQLIINKYILLKQRLQEVEQTIGGTNFDGFDTLDSSAIIDILIGNKSMVKSEDIEEYGCNENKSNNERPTPKRGRGRPSTRSYLVTKSSRMSSSAKKRRKMVSKSLKNRSKGRICTEEGKEVFLSRTKRLKCQWPGCDSMFRDREDLENHLWRHTGEKAYGCDWPGCNKSFSSRCYLKKHHLTHLDPNVFKCLHENCLEKFITSGELNEHFISGHFGEKPFRCDWPGCCQQFAVKRNLKDHQVVHIDEKRFACDWPGCESAFKRKQQLEIHVCEVHQSEGKLRCDWPGCDSTFSSHNKMKIHKMRHTGEKPFKCSWTSCDSSFRQHNHLKTHMLKHTGEKPFPCEWIGCDRKFQTKQTLRFHCEKSHQNLQNHQNVS